MIRTLLAVAAVGLAGSVSLAPPLSMWAGWMGLTAFGLVVFLVTWVLLDWMGNRAARDARKRARLDVRTWRP